MYIVRWLQPDLTSTLPKLPVPVGIRGKTGRALNAIANAQLAAPAFLVPGFFSNLRPLFAAVMSAAFLGELPNAHHALAFALIGGGIWESSRRG